MAKCLCCNKELSPDDLYWHKSCIKSFFDLTSLPSIDLNDVEGQFKTKAEQLLDDKNVVTGVQKKLSLGLSKDEKKLTIKDYPQGYIIKPENNEYKEIARAEHLVMSMADSLNIRTAPHGLLPFKNGSYIYITKRIDRLNNTKIHMEDMCQLSNKMTEDKYDGSYEYLGKRIIYFTNKQDDIIEYYYLILFCFISCNSDMHLKNFSLVESDDISLSKAYDLLPVNIIYPNDQEDVALTLNGKKKNLRRNDFIKLGESLNIPNRTMLYLFNEIYSHKNNLLKMIDESLLSDKFKKDFKEELARRIEIFK